MPLRNRTRMVYFRVSDEEFQQFADLRDRHGARSMSDLVRVAMKKMVEHRDEFETDVAERLKRLENSMERLKEVVAGGEKK